MASSSVAGHTSTNKPISTHYSRPPLQPVLPSVQAALTHPPEESSCPKECLALCRNQTILHSLKRPKVIQPLIIMSCMKMVDIQPCAIRYRCPSSLITYQRIRHLTVTRYRRSSCITSSTAAASQNHRTCLCAVHSLYLKRSVPAKGL